MADGAGGARSLARRAEHALAFGGLVAFVVWQTWPLAARMWTEVWGLVLLDYVHPDVYLNLWIVSWVARSIATAPSTLPHLPAFHPAHWVLGYSEHMLGVLPVTLPAYLATGDPVFTNQFLLLATFVLSAFGMALLVTHWTQSGAGGVVAGAFFALARWRFRNVPQIQLLATFYAPLVLLFSSRYLRVGGRGNLLATAGFFLAQALCSYSQAYPMYAGSALFWIVHARAVGARPRRLAMLFAAALAATAVVAVASLPQIMAQRLGTSDTNPAWNAASMLERDPGAPLSAWIDPSAKMFPGYACGVAALVGLLLALTGAGTRRWPVGGRALAASLVAFALPLVVLAAGPADGGLLAWAWRIVPGLARYRHPERFAYLVSLPLAALGGMAVAVLQQEARARGAAASAAVWAAVVLGLLGLGQAQLSARRGLRLAPVPPRPAVYDWVKEHVAADEAILEIPAGIAAPRGFRYRADPEYLLWNFHHRRPLVNGYSGYAPLIYPLVLNLAAQLPEPAALETLVRMTGMRWIIVHLGKLEPAERARWDGASDLAVAARIGEDVVLAVDRTDTDWQLLYQRPPADRTLAGTPLAAVDGRAELHLQAPREVSAGSSIAVRARIRNAGAGTWPSLSPHAEQRVALVWRWSKAGEPPSAARPALLGWETIPPNRPIPPPLVSVVPRDLAPGEEIEVGTVITSPRVAGAYELIGEVVQGTERFATPGGDEEHSSVRVLGQSSGRRD